MNGLFKTYIRLLKKQLKQGTSASGCADIMHAKGTRLWIRPATPADTRQLFEMHQRLSRRTIYWRYLRLHTPTMQEMAAITTLCGAEGSTMIAQQCEPDHTIIGLAYFRSDPANSRKTPELAMIVEDGFQGGGIGKALLDRLLQHAGSRGWQALYAAIHPQNHRMRRLLDRTGFIINERICFDMVEVNIQLRPNRHSGGRRASGTIGLSKLFSGLDLGLS